MVVILPDVLFDLLDQLGEDRIDRVDRHPLEQPDRAVDGGAVKRVVVDLAIHREAR